MIYPNTYAGTFLSRPNRFIAHAELDGEAVVAHVKNTGRCQELLIPGAKVVLQRAKNPSRKTGFDLISVWKGARLINMDSQAPNTVFLEYLRAGRYMEDITLIKPEARYKSSRFDFYIESRQRKAFIEVKGVTLEENGVVLFPDAPTERGVRHLQELSECVREGYEAYIIFVIQMSDVRYFTPNIKTHPAFGDALVAAAKAGVHIVAFDCTVTESSLAIGNTVPVRLPEEPDPALKKRTNIYDYQRPLGKIEDAPEQRADFITQYDAGSKADMVRFGMLLGEHLIERTGFEARKEILCAFHAMRRWLRKETNYHEARNIAFGDLYREAREENNPVKERFYRTMAQIACIPHCKHHALWATDFAVTLINRMLPGDLGEVKKERAIHLALIKQAMSDQEEANGQHCF